MGIQAAYTTVDTAELDRLVELPGDDLVEAIEALETAGNPTLYLDKTWDGLHFLLTGVSASSPAEDDPLSEAVVGVHVFDSEDFVGCTEVDELPAIIAALESVDVAGLLERADFADFARAEIYPNIWSDDPAVLRQELSAAFDGILAFLRVASSAERHVVVSIL